MSRQPKRDLRRRQRRKKKVRYLKKRLAETHSSERRKQLVAKMRKVAPNAPIPGE